MTREIPENQILKVTTKLTTEQVQKFFTATPPEKIKTRPAKGGGNWKYVSGSYTTQVLNSLFGFNWSFEIVTSMTEALATANTGTVVVQGRLKVKIGDEWITKEQFGRKDVTYRVEYVNGKKVPTDKLLDFGNDLKAAGTDAKKKCASELGLFADVYTQEDFFEATILENDKLSQWKPDPNREPSEQQFSFLDNMFRIKGVNGDDERDSYLFDNFGFDYRHLNQEQAYEVLNDWQAETKEAEKKEYGR